MSEWLKYLIEWICLPVLGPFDELDMQIDKLRVLRDSYQVPSQGSGYETTTDVS